MKRLLYATPLLAVPLLLALNKGDKPTTSERPMPITATVMPRAKSDQPRPAGEPFDKKAYRKRSRVECAVGWLKECRRLGTRYEKLALNFLAFAKLAFVLKYLRVLDSSDRA